MNIKSKLKSKFLLFLLKICCFIFPSKVFAIDVDINNLQKFDNRRFMIYRYKREKMEEERIPNQYKGTKIVPRKERRVIKSLKKVQYYFSIAGGANFVKNYNAKLTNSEGSTNFKYKIDSGNNFLNGSLGVHLNNLFRLEGQYLYSTFKVKDVSGDNNVIANDIKSQDDNFNLNAIFANVIFSPRNAEKKLFPYFGLGIGPAIFKNNLGRNNGYLWQATSGISYHVSDKLGFYGGYRYLKSFNFENSFKRNNLDTKSVESFASHDIEFGLRYYLY